MGVTTGLMIYYLWPQQTTSVEATIYHQGAELYDLDLSKETVERTFVVEGTHTPLTVGVKKNAIAILKSGCPNQYCVEEGWVSDPHRSLICAYNDIYIFLEGASSMDVIAG